MQFLAILSLFSAVCLTHAASSSQACSFAGGVMRCVDNSDPNGNSAVSFSGGSNGPYAGQGYPGQGYPGGFAPFNGFPNGYFPFQPQFPFVGRR